MLFRWLDNLFGLRNMNEPKSLKTEEKTSTNFQKHMLLLLVLHSLKSITFSFSSYTLFPFNSNIIISYNILEQTWCNIIGIFRCPLGSWPKNNSIIKVDSWLLFSLIIKSKNIKIEETEENCLNEKNCLLYSLLSNNNVKVCLFPAKAKVSRVH